MGGTLTLPLVSIRYHYDRGRLQELISELEAVSFDINSSHKKTKRGKVSHFVVAADGSCVVPIVLLVCVFDIPTNMCTPHACRKPLSSFVSAPSFPLLLDHSLE